MPYGATFSLHPPLPLMLALWVRSGLGSGVGGVSAATAGCLLNLGGPQPLWWLLMEHCGASP